MVETNITAQPNNVPGQDGAFLVRRLLQLSEEIYRNMKLSVPPEWLKSDMTVAQLRVLLMLYAEGPSQMNSIASSLDIAVSTATGIVDNLVKKGLVTRGTKPEDRRVVICMLSDQGQKTVNRMWTLTRFQFKRLLKGLSMEQLRKTVEVAEFLLANVEAPDTKPT